MGGNVLFYKKLCARISNGKVRHIEDPPLHPMYWGLGGLGKTCICIFEICKCNEICRLDTNSESKSKHLFSSKKFYFQ